MIGAGFVAGFHERALCSVRGVELAGVCAPQGAEALAERAREDGLGNTQIFESQGSRGWCSDQGNHL